MMAPVASTVVSAIMAAVLHLRLRGRDKTDFLPGADA